VSAGGALLPVDQRVSRATPETWLFAKLYARSHLRADRWYKLGRALLYGRLEDKKPFNTVRRFVQQEDHALALMQRAGLPSPEREYPTRPGRSPSSASAHGASASSLACWPARSSPSAS
jgi:hypothetical protein